MENDKKNLAQLLTAIFSGVALTVFLIALIFLLCTVVREERETHRLLLQAFGNVRPADSTATDTTSRDLPVDIPAGGNSETTAAPVPIVSVDLAASGERVSNGTSYGVDEEALLSSSLTYRPAGNGPTVLLIHSHPEECYTPKGVSAVDPSFDYTSTRRSENVYAVGEAVAEVLHTAGIGVIHAGDSDADAAAIVRKYRQVYPSLTFVLDIHRDGVITTDGRIVRSDGKSGALSCAQLMLAVGSDLAAGGRDGWQKDLAAACQLAETVNENEPGIMRATLLRPEGLGQGEAPCQLNLYVGTTGNTLEEAIVSARLFAKYYAIFLLRHTAEA